MVADDEFMKIVVVFPEMGNRLSRFEGRKEGSASWALSCTRGGRSWGLE